ncbi:MAG: DUF3999 family protein [Planctomycetota bacterium]
MNRFLMALVVGGILAGGSAFADAPLARFRWQKAVLRPEGAGGSVAAVGLDGEMYAGTGDDFPDIRLLDDAGRETPFVLRVRREERTAEVETAVEMETISFEKQPDNRVEVTFRRKNPDRTPVCAEIRTTLRNFEKQVRMSGSADRKEWKVLAEGRPVFDYSRYIDLANKRVEFAPGAWAYYRLEIANITERRQSPFVLIAKESRGGEIAREMEGAVFEIADFRMEQVVFYDRKPVVTGGQAVSRDYPVTGFEVSEDAKNRRTRITFGTGRAPITEIRMIPASFNFCRAAGVEGESGEGGAARWTRFVSAELHAIRAGAYQREKTDIAWDSPRRYPRMRLVLENRDSPPVAIEGVSARGLVHEIVFFPEGGRAYRVLYGAAGLAAPRYDIDEVLAKAGTRPAEPWSVGPQAANPDFRAAAPPSRVDGKTLLTVSILIMVVALVWVLARVLKKMDGVKTE